jgi:phytoene synthase
MPRATLATIARGGHLAAMNALAETVRLSDPDRYFCALLAPAARRDGLFTLYAFNHELARALEVAREPGLSLIRLHWWREVVEGEARRHEVATPLRALVASGGVPAALLLEMIAAREAVAVDPPATLDAVAAGPGALAAAAGAVLGAAAADLAALRAVPMAWLERCAMCLPWRWPDAARCRRTC